MREYTITATITLIAESAEDATDALDRIFTSADSVTEYETTEPATLSEQTEAESTEDFVNAARNGDNNARRSLAATGQYPEFEDKGDSKP